MNVLTLLGGLPASIGYLTYRAVSERFARFDPEQFRAEKVYCVGSGPSLDQFDLERIQNSTVILLNSAIDINKRVHPSNALVWMCQDTEALLATYRRVPHAIAKIVSVHHYGKAWRVLSLIKKKDFFFVARPVFREKYPTRGDPPPRRLYLRPRLAGFGGEPLVIDPISRRSIYPISVMLLAIAVALRIAKREIHLVGFDMGAGPQQSANNYSNAVLSAAATSPDRFPTREIERYLGAFHEAANCLSIEICNHSPYAAERILSRNCGF